MPAGRPTELTPEVLEDVRRLLPTVLYLETVADYIGHDRITFRAWLKRGVRELKRLRGDTRRRVKKSEAIFLEFYNVVRKSLAEGEIYDTGVIKKASEAQWTAAAWRLERRHPERWGRRDTLDVNVREIDRRIERELARLVTAGQAALPGTTPAPGTPAAPGTATIIGALPAPRPADDAGG